MRRIAITLLLAVSVLTPPATAHVASKAFQEAAKTPSQQKPAPTQVGEINLAPLKEVLTILNVPYRAYNSDISDVKFSAMTGFKVEGDGSLTNIHIIKSSGSKIVDSRMLQILWNIGESRVLGPISDLSSATLDLDVTDDVARLRLVAFGSTPEIAKRQAGLLNVLFWALRTSASTTPDVAKLLSLITVRSEGKRVDVGLTVPRASAVEMLQSPVPVAKEPRHHLKFENQFVRVFDVMVPPGDATLFHVHSNDYAFVSIGDATLKAQALGGQPADLILKDGEVRFTKGPITHRVTNIANDQFRNITIEILGTPGPSGAAKPDTSPGLSTVLDNGRIHIERLVLEPGQSTIMHTHNLSALSVFLTTAKVRVESPGQKPQTMNYKPGDFRWRSAPTTHKLKNIGSTRFEAVGIDWK